MTTTSNQSHNTSKTTTGFFHDPYIKELTDSIPWNDFLNNSEIEELYKSIKREDPIMEKIRQIINEKYHTDKTINDTDEWVEVKENSFDPGKEYLLAFRSPVDLCPMYRVGKINQANNLLIMSGPRSNDFINLGNYKKIGQIWCKKLPTYPQQLLSAFN